MFVVCVKADTGACCTISSSHIQLHRARSNDSFLQTLFMKQLSLGFLQDLCLYMARKAALRRSFGQFLRDWHHTLASLLLSSLHDSILLVTSDLPTSSETKALTPIEVISSYPDLPNKYRSLSKYCFDHPVTNCDISKCTTRNPRGEDGRSDPKGVCS